MKTGRVAGRLLQFFRQEVMVVWTKVASDDGEKWSDFGYV